jgi:enediyne biosynthesis protein E4
MGENFYLQPAADKPVKLFINDFDGNGSTEKIMTRTVDGKDMPVFMKREMVEQIPSLKKQNLKNSSYAGKSIQDLFAAGLLKKSVVKEVNYTASVIAVNEGNGKFTVKPLPLNVQLSSVAAVLCTDVETTLILFRSLAGSMQALGMCSSIKAGAILSGWPIKKAGWNCPAK